MSPAAYDILDELYFVTSFQDLVKMPELAAYDVEASLKELVQQGFVKCLYPDPDTEISNTRPDFDQVFKASYFLATKAGLLAHNSR